MKTLYARALLTTLLLFLAACAGTDPGTEEVEIPGYGTLQEPLKGRDVSALQGRRIVLDPGHGGYFAGAVGLNGLTEAEVNLGVALHLRGLLEWAGARVWMTRTADTDFLSPADSTLATDLALRVAFTDSLQPDVLLSLHHNSVASLDRTVNETQTYYPLGDAGASLDLARSIHRHLVLNLEITPAKILPGNFHVLRHATVPAVLGEPAMISNPVIEGRLSLAASQRLEAEAYFLGLLDYFAQGNPVWSGAARDTLPPPPPGGAAAMTWFYHPDGMDRDVGPGPGLDPTSVRITLDGAPQPFDLAPDGRSVRWQAPGRGLDAPGILEISARNLAGRSTPSRRTLVPATRAAAIRVTAYGDLGRTDPVLVGWRTDSGRPAPAGRLVLGPEMALDTEGRNGGWASVAAGTWPAGEVAPSFAPHAESEHRPTLVFDSLELPAPWRWVPFVHADGGLVTDASPAVQRAGGGPGDVRPGAAAPDSPLAAWHTPEPLWLEIPGYRPLVLGPAGDHEAGAPGPDLTPLFPGLLGRVVVIDPAGGGSDTDGAGPLGLRGADLNLAVANLLADLLRGAGAEPHLTRHDGTVPTPEQKVARAGRVGADYFLTIGRTRTADGPTVAHHHGSVTGIRWAGLTAAAVDPLIAPADSIVVNPAWDYLLRHTACPALEIRLPGPETAAIEMRMNDQAWRRAEAAVLFQGFAAVAAGGDTLLPILDPAAVAGWPGVGIDTADVDLVVLDGQFAWAPPAATAAGTPDRQEGADLLSSWQEPGWPAPYGDHTLEVRHEGRWTLYRLLTGPATNRLEMLMSGP